MTKRETLDAAGRGEGCLGKSEDSEPVFVLCARDIFAADLVRMWADRVEAYAARTGDLDKHRKAKIQRAREDAMRMEQWSQANQATVPS